jgi:hypothetical protein
MRLTLGRRENTMAENSTLYYTSVDLTALPEGATLYYLDVDLEASPDETALIESNGWGAMPLCKGSLRGVGGRVDFDLSDVLGTLRLGFDTIENFANVERQPIESVNKVNQLLGDFSGGMSTPQDNWRSSINEACRRSLGSPPQLPTTATSSSITRPWVFSSSHSTPTEIRNT